MSVSDHRPRQVTPIGLLLRHAARRGGLFGRSEDGSLIIFSLFIFVLMLMMGGIAVDVMRFENVRAKMMNTMDRAVLAAADLDQTVDPKVVVKDYLSKVGLTVTDNQIRVFQNGTEMLPGVTQPLIVTSRSVQVETAVPMGTMFMRLMGINELPVPGNSLANESVNDIEISLILDISGSMGQQSFSGETKLHELKVAAKNFVDDIFDDALDGRISMSVVPYSTQVNAGPLLLSQYNVTNEHNFSHCVEFEDFQYDQIEIAHSPSVPLQLGGHFDPWTWYNVSRTPQTLVCRTDPGAEITVMSQNVAALKGQIDNLTAEGNTSIDVAVKWGTALLDPSSSTVVDNLITAGAVDGAFSGRPLPFNRDNTLKIMVVMTDGINTSEMRLRWNYRQGLSGIWKDPDSGFYSIEDEEFNDRDGDGRWREDYWVFRNPDGTGGFWRNQIYDDGPDGDSNPDDPDGDIYEMTWPQVWAEMTLSYHAFYNRYAQGRWSSWNADHYWDDYYGPRRAIGGNAKDGRLSRICAQARAQNVIVYTVGYEVTDDSALVLQDCAGNDNANNFYRVSGSDIDYAFSSIANQINQLKLSQ